MCTRQEKKWPEFLIDANEESHMSALDQRITLSIMQKSLICQILNLDSAGVKKWNAMNRGLDS